MDVLQVFLQDLIFLSPDYSMKNGFCVVVCCMPDCNSRSIILCDDSVKNLYLSTRAVSSMERFV